jgi:hypothetical protein
MRHGDSVPGGVRGPGALRAIRPREASIFACFADTVVAPGGGLPAVRETDAAFAFDAQLRAAPPANRAGLRLVLLALELAPLALGFGARLRRLAPVQREAVLARLERSAVVAAALQALRGLAPLRYYGDPGVLRQLGYDADAVVARARDLRAQEVRW